MEAICSSDTSVGIQRTTRRYIPEDGTLHNHYRENLKSYTAATLPNFVVDENAFKSSLILFMGRGR
jgi:hypothetical protein